MWGAQRVTWGMREDKGGVFTPILTFPPQGGDGEGGRPRGDAPTGEGECVGWWEWRTVMGWRALSVGR